jgi:CBS domain-containing protein
VAEEVQYNNIIYNIIMEARREAQAFLQGTALDAFLAGRPPCAVACVSPHATCADALALLARCDILAAPVLGPHGNYQGFLDVLDIASAVVEWAAEADVVGGGGGHRGRALEAVGRRLSATAVRDLPRADDGQLLAAAHGGMTMLDVVRHGFVAPRRKLWCHRVAVCDPDAGALRAVVSQIDVVHHLHRHAAQLPALMATPIDSLGVALVGVVSVDAGAPAIDALGAMLAGAVPAVAVLEGGKFAANLSASDLRGLQPRQFGLLALPVREFLARRAADAREWHLLGAPAAAYGVRPPPSGPDREAPAACALDAPVGEAIELMSDRGVHRVYLMPRGADPAGQEDEEGAALGGPPVGVLSLTDLLTALAL